MQIKLINAVQVILRISEKTWEDEEGWLEERRSYDNNLWFYIYSSSCFQLVGKESYDINDMQSLLQDPNNIDLNKVYDKYNVEGVQVIFFQAFQKVYK